MSEPSILSPRRLLVVAGFTLAFALVFWPVFMWMAERFNTHDSFYSHGWLVPVASAWLIWQRRERLARCPRRATFWGLALLVPSLAIHTLAPWWGLHFVAGFALLGALWGLVWTLWGFSALWTLRFPMLFLLFMVPLPGIVLIFISFKMKLFAAMLAAHAVSLLGIPAQQAGSTIHVPGVSVIVDDTCSGLSPLLTPISFSLLLSPPM